MTNPANDAVRSSTQAVTQQLQQAKTDTAAATKAVTNDGQKSIDAASKLTDCVSKAGTDTSVLAACQSTVGG